jgi:ADP-ribosyl-[dinitrogen reductase] hydrolase
MTRTLTPALPDAPMTLPRHVDAGHTSSTALKGRARLFDHALGAYLGLALGDALGATVEFMTATEIAHRHGVHRELVGGGWLHLKPGQVTDDTTMSLALGDALVLGHHAGRPFDAGLMADAFVSWLRSKPVDCGNTCRRGIVRYLADGSMEGPLSDGDGGNGALMRNLPVVLATLGAPTLMAQASIRQAHITHHHLLSDEATLAFGALLQVLITHPEPERVMPLCGDIGEELVARHPAFRFNPYPGRASAYVVDTVQTVLHHFFRGNDAESTMVATVNQGGDADTTGALVGMLVGARGGASALPTRWLRKLDPAVKLAITDQTSNLLALSLSA